MRSDFPLNSNVRWTCTVFHPSSTTLSLQCLDLSPRLSRGAALSCLCRRSLLLVALRASLSSFVSRFVPPSASPLPFLRPSPFLLLLLCFYLLFLIMIMPYFLLCFFVTIILLRFLCLFFHLFFAIYIFSCYFCYFFVSNFYFLLFSFSSFSAKIFFSHVLLYFLLFSSVFIFFLTVLYTHFPWRTDCCCPRADNRGGRNHNRDSPRAGRHLRGPGALGAC